MPSGYDAVVIGAGPAGETAISRLTAAGMSTALIERELIGGECAYWACIPSKTLLRAGEARAHAARVAGLSTSERRWGELARYRDYMIRHLDDSQQRADYEQRGVSVYRGEAKITAEGAVEVNGQALWARRILIATGSAPAVPEIAGLDEAGYWTNRQATSLERLPASVIVLGGGPVGIELGQFLARFGARVTIVHDGPRLLEREDPRVGALLAELLATEGIDVRVGAQARRVRAGEGARRVALADGSEAHGDELLVATGRSARTEGLGAEQAGARVDARGVCIDERCRAADRVWAIGDVTGVMPFTHVASYQARVACADIAGEAVRADYAAIPRVVFCDPEVAAVGMTLEQAREAELEIASARLTLAQSISRPYTYEIDPRGELGLLFDRRRRVLVGAWAVAPLAAEWIHYAALAIKTQAPLELLRDTVAQFPTYTEAYLKAIEQLKL